MNVEDYKRVERQGAAVFGLRQALADFCIAFGIDDLNINELFEFVVAHINPRGAYGNTPPSEEEAQS